MLHGLHFFQYFGCLVFFIEKTGFVGPPLSQTFFLLLQGNKGKPAEKRRYNLCFPSKCGIDILQEFVRLFGDMLIVAILPPCGPNGAGICCA